MDTILKALRLIFFSFPLLLEGLRLLATAVCDLLRQACAPVAAPA